MQQNHMAILTISNLYVSGISYTAIYMTNYRCDRSEERDIDD